MHGLLILFVVLAVAKQCLSTWADGAAYKPDPGPPGPNFPWWTTATRGEQFYVCFMFGISLAIVVGLLFIR